MKIKSQDGRAILPCVGVSITQDPQHMNVMSAVLPSGAIRKIGIYRDEERSRAILNEIGEWMNSDERRSRVYTMPPDNER